MKNIRIPETLMWVLLIIGAVAGAGMIGWQAQEEWRILPEAERQPVLSAGTVTDATTQFATGHFGVDLSSYTPTAILSTVEIPDTFLTKSYLSTEAQSQYRDMYLSAPTIYAVRYFKPEQIEEYQVALDAYRGDVVSFTQTVPEDALIPDVSEEVAIAAARAYVAKLVGVDSSLLTLHHKEEKKLPGGTARDITLAWQGSEVDSTFGKGFTIFTLTMRGDLVSAFATSFEYPETFEREVVQSVTVGGLVGFGSIVMWIILLVASLVVTIRFFTAHIALWKPALVVTILLAIFNGIDFANNYTELLYWYSTIDSMTAHYVISIFGLVFGLLIASLMFIAPAVAGYTLAVTSYRDRIEPLTALPRSDERRTAYRTALLRGYLLGIAFLGFTLAIFWIGETYLGLWLPMGDPLATFGLNSFIPALSLMITLGIGAAVTEEITFRLFGILWLQKLTKSTALAVLIATAVWAFAHTDGSVLPVWFRGVEVFMGGLLFAYFFIRYNILTTIIAHYVHNILIACMLLYFTFGAAQIIPMILIFAMPVIVYLIVELATRK